MAAALGARLLDDEGKQIEPTGAGLQKLARIDMSAFEPRVAEALIRVACDVDNPLYGPQGAAHVYGPQKGASPEVVEQLDRGLRRFAEVAQRDLGLDLAQVPGAGAAGGLGAGLLAFCGARLERGVQIVIDTVGLREKMRGCDLCLTGEGRLDFQTAFGKTPKGVADVAGECGVPVIAFGGSVADDAHSLNSAFAALFSICAKPMTIQEAMRPDTAVALISFTAEQIVRCYMAGREN
jgi:glycerate kinase